MIGSELGPYQVVAKLGEGGMGEVYRARDTRLDRQVAIKILQQSFAADPAWNARFEREAKLLATLNHAHIAQIYGLEDSGQMRALVMELVEGPTLADRIAQGPLPLDEALSIARQIAEALEAAHEQGIIHRDLKPANIKLRPDGAVKVLDFGLAKLADPAHGSIEASALTSPGMTGAGLVVGTPAYMSPEQARGQRVDSRTDLWAFGCVCYEMLAGRRAFDGETASDAISAVLLRDPDWSALPEGTPAPVLRLLRRCLARDVSRRLCHAGDARLELEEIASGDSAEVRTSPRHVRAPFGYLPWAITAVASIAALWLGWQRWGVTGAGPAAPPPTTRLELSLPSGLELFASTSTSLVASPDGRSIAFVATSGGSRQVFLRRLDAVTSTPVRGTVGASSVTFLGDGESLAFVTAGGELKTSSLTDGLVTTVARDASLLYGFTWAADSAIVFTRAGSLWTVPRSGGTARQLTTLAAGEQMHAWPSALPDGRTVLFTVQTAAAAHVEALTLATGERRIVLNQAIRAKVGPEGRLFFSRDNRLLASEFDLATESVIGTPIQVLDRAGSRRRGTRRRCLTSRADGVSARVAAAPPGLGVATGGRRADQRYAARLYEPAVVAGRDAHRCAGRKHLAARPPEERLRTSRDAEHACQRFPDVAAGRHDGAASERPRSSSAEHGQQRRGAHSSRHHRVRLSGSGDAGRPDPRVPAELA